MNNKDYTLFKVGANFKEPFLISIIPFQEPQEFNKIEEAKEAIKNFKRSRESFPYIVTNSEGKLVYVEYPDYCLEKKDI